jgi:hypothetical protein
MRSEIDVRTFVKVCLVPDVARTADLSDASTVHHGLARVTQLATTRAAANKAFAEAGSVSNDACARTKDAVGDGDCGGGDSGGGHSVNLMLIFNSGGSG